MASGLSDHVWTIKELIERAEQWKKKIIERVKAAIAPIKVQLDEAKEIVFSDDGQSDPDGIELLNRYSKLMNAWHAVNNHLDLKGRH